MAANDRETTFTIRAADLSTQQINQVVASVERLLAVQQKQNDAAEKGAVKTSEFNKSLKDLSTGADAVARQITALQRYAAVAEEVAVRQQKLADLQAQRQAVAERENPTKADEREGARLDKQITSAQKSFDNQIATMAKAEAQMQRMGSSTATLGTDLDRLRAFADRLQITLDASAVAGIHLTEAQMKAAEAAKVQAAAEEAAAKAVKDVEEAQKALTRQREADMDAMKRAYDFEQKLLQASLAAADERLAKEKALAEQREKVAAQRDLTAGGLSAASRVSPLGESQTAAPDFSNVTRGISGLIDPANAARHTLEGLISEIDKLSDSLSGGGRRRAEDIQNDIRNIGIAAAELKRQGGMIDAFQAQEAATLKAQKSMQAMQAEMERLSAKGRQLTAVDKEYANEVKTTEAELKRLIAAYERENAELTRQQALLQRTGIDHKNLDETISRMRASASGVGQALGSVEEKLKGKGGGGGRSGEVLFGLRPYELQNLSYQINDVFTQLASGTSLQQTLSQQGGQIFQLFQRQIGGALVSLRAIPFAFAGIGVAAAAATVGVLAFVRAVEVAGERRQLLAALTQNVDGTRYSAEKLLDSAKDMQRFGVNLDEAAGGVRALVAAGAEPERIKPLMQLAAAFANANALKFPDAMKQVVAAFTGSGKQLLDFATQTNSLLSADQFKRIRSLVEAGDVVQARFEAFAAMYPRMEKAAEENTSAITKSWRSLRAAWDSLLDAIGSNVLVDFFGNTLLSALRSATEAGASLFKVLNSIFTFDVKDMPLGRTLAELAGFGGLYAKIAGPAPQPGTSSGGGVGPGGGVFTGGSQGSGNERNIRNNNPVNLNFIGQQGATLETGVPAPRFAKFENMETGVSAALGQALLDQSRGLKTIEQLVMKYVPPGKENSPEVVKKYISEVAAALGVKPNEPVDLTNRDLAMKYIAATAKHEGGVPQQEQIERGVDFRLAGGKGNAASPTEAQKIATANFEKARQEQEDSQRKAFATEAEAYEIFQRDLARAKEKVTAEAQAQADKNHAGVVDQAAQDKAIESAQDDVRKEYHERWLQRLREREAFMATIRERELAADKSNLSAREKLINDQFDKEQLQARELASKGNYGIPLDKIDDDINKARQQALDRAAVDVSKVIIEDAVKQRDATLAIIRQKINMPGANIPDLLSQATKTALDALPALNKKLDDAQRALDKVAKLPGGVETEEVKTARAQIALLREQAKRPEAIGQLIQQGAGTVQEGVTGAVQQNKAQLDIISDSVKVAGVSATDAINRIVEFGKKSVPALRDLVGTTNAGLQAIADNPLTDPRRKQQMLTEIQQNMLAPSKAAVDLQTAIMAALTEQRAQLDKLIAEYKHAVADLDNKIRESRMTPLAAAAERAKLDANYIPRIAQQGKDYQGAIGAARGAGTQLGLGPAFQAGLSEEEARSKTESDPNTLAAESVRDSAKQNIDKARQALATATEMQRTQQELVSRYATTQDEANAVTKQSFDDAKEQVDALASSVQGNIDKLIQLGDITGARKLAADFKLLQSEVKYVDPEMKKLADTLENSIVSHATQAFETIAEAIGKVVAGTGSWKDVLSSVGTAFASFAAGVLKDLAAMIIKMYLFKTVQSAIGGAGILHAGGLVGSDGATRPIDMSVFNFARRMHDGGAIGLASDEVPAILQRGEMVLSKAQVAANQQRSGSSGSGQTGIRNVLVVGDKEIAGAMSGAHGEKVIMNVLQRNAPTIKKYVG